MKSRTAIFILLIMVMPIVQAIAADKQDTTVPDSVRIERLAGLCELWGVAKYFHPYLAYKDIEWDQALIKTIPRINKAVTSDEYKRAIEYMLTFLKDPNTYVIDESYVTPRSKISDSPGDDDYYPQIVWTEDSIAIVVANDFARLYETGMTGFCRDFLPEARKSNGVIFDIRNLGDDESESVGNTVIGNFIGILKLCLPDILTTEVPIPVSRRIVLSPHTDDITGWHESSFLYGPGETIIPNKEKENNYPVPLSFVVNEGSADMLPFLGGLQKAGQASIIFEGHFDREGGIDTYKMQLPDEIEVMIRISELINSDGTESVHPDFVIPYTTDTTVRDCPPVKSALDIIRGIRKAPPIMGLFLPPNARNRASADYDEFLFMKPAYRMMALFMVWNEIKYLYPYLDRLGKPWDSVLAEFIPEFEAADTKKSYAMAFNRLRNRIQNSNTRAGSSDPIDFLGEYFPPIAVSLIEGKTAITNIAEGDSAKSGHNMSVGDIIIEVDGEDIDIRRKRLAGYLSASSPQAMQREVNALLLSSTSPTDLKLKMMTADGDIKEAIIGRSEFDNPEPELPRGFQIIDNDIIYIRPFGIDATTIADSLDTIINAGNLVIDLRGDWNSAYLHRSYWSLIGKLADKQVSSCLVRAIGKNAPDVDEYSWLYRTERITPDNGRGFRGKIAVIIDASTSGDAEKYCLYLKAAADTKLIGTPSNGTPGYVGIIDLPGGLSFSYTNAELLHPDGKPVYGVGIQPDIYVEPTIEGVRRGEDEILEAAIEYLEKELKK